MQREMLTFVIVGGGPTGVELAGAIAELARHGLAREFRAIDPSMARVILMQAGPRILPTFPEGLSRQATTALTTLGVEVLTDSAVEQIDEEGVVVSGRRVAARNAFWAAGVMASPAAKWLKAEADRAGRVKVVEDLSVPGLPDVFAIGDTALSNGWNGNPVPGLAPAAKQQGRYVASVIKARIEGRRPPLPSDIAMQAVLRRSAGRRRSPISAGCGSPVLSPGGSGASSTSCSCQGCVIEW